MHSLITYFHTFQSHSLQHLAKTMLPHTCCFVETVTRRPCTHSASSMSARRRGCIARRPKPVWSAPRNERAPCWLCPRTVRMVVLVPPWARSISIDKARTTVTVVIIVAVAAVAPRAEPQRCECWIWSDWATDRFETFLVYLCLLAFSCMILFVMLPKCQCVTA